MQVVVGPEKAVYCIKHLQPTTYTFGVTVRGTAYDLPIHVVYRDHCYSRGFDPSLDDSSALLPGDHMKDPRVFCADRWDYSHQLPKLVGDLIQYNGACYPTTNAGLFFKVDRTGVNIATNRNDGWHLFFELGPNPGAPGLKVTVRSSHERTSWPSNAKGRTSLRLRVAITDYLKKRERLLQGLQPK